jgi:hypothetical protein
MGLCKPSNVYIRSGFSDHDIDEDLISKRLAIWVVCLPGAAVRAWLIWCCKQDADKRFRPATSREQSLVPCMPKSLPAIKRRLYRSSQLQVPLFSTSQRLSSISPGENWEPSGILRSSRKVSWLVQEGVADGLSSRGVLKGSAATVGEAISGVGGIYRGACVTVRVTGAGGYPLQAANAPGRKTSQPSASTANLNGKPASFIP